MTNRAQREHGASVLYGMAMNQHAVVVGAGPTLDEQLTWLATSKIRPLITVPAALRPLQGRNIMPDIVVLMESSTSNVGYLDDVDMKRLTRTMLVYNPECDPKFLEMWPGPKLYVNELYLAGTVLHTAADLATRMGCTEVTLVGFDACMPKGKHYASGAGVLGEGYDDTPFSMWVIDGNGGKVLAQPRMTNWARGMQDLIAARPLVKFYKRGRAGADIKGCEWRD